MSDTFRKKIHYNDLVATFDDMIILPGFTNFDIEDVDITSRLDKYEFNIPIISSAMDTVTEELMAIKMALLGGLGVLHRNCSYEKQLEMVRKVKRARSFVIDDVATIKNDAKLAEAKLRMEKDGISGLVVLDENDKVCGIFTKRDFPYKEEMIITGNVRDYMTKDVVSIKPGVSREEALSILFENRIEKLPIIDNGHLTGLITRKDLKPEFPLASKDEEGRLLCALAISPKFPENIASLKILKEI